MRISDWSSDVCSSDLVDPEILEQVSVNLGVTDVDSPTASAVGGTINIRTRVPSDEFGVTTTISYGDIFASGRQRSRPYMRGFLMLDSGDITGMGRSEEHTSELQSLMRISYAVFCLKKKTKKKAHHCQTTKPIQ